jgi:hypothetical protein
MDAQQTDLEALTKIIGALKQMSIDEQTRTLQAVSVFLGLNVGFPRAQVHSAIASEPSRSTTFGVVGSSFSENRDPSPKEFLRDKNPASDVERVACLGFYLSHYRDTPHFKTVDISALNTEAAQPKFSNASMAVDNASKAGLLVQAVKGAKQLSSNGEHYVQLLPDREAAREMLKSSNVRRKPRRTGAKKSLSALEIAVET